MAKELFVPLHVHTDCSILDGYQTVDEYAAYCEEKGYTAAAITDHGVCTGHEAFDYAILTKKYSFKPIFGMETYLTDDVSNHISNRVARDKKGNIKYDKKTGEPIMEPQKPRDFNHGCLWAKNNVGLSNLWTLSTLAYLDGFYYKPRIDLAMLRKYHEGLFVSDGCLLSQVARAAVAAMNVPENEKQKFYDSAENWVKGLIDIFGKDSVLIELHTWQFTKPSNEEQTNLNAQMRAANKLKLHIAKKYGLRTIAVNDAHYNKREDFKWHELEWSTTTGKGAEFNDDKTEGRGETAAWCMTTDEVKYWLVKNEITEEDANEAIANTAWVGEQCNAKLERGMKSPRYKNTKAEDEAYFDKVVISGFKELVPKSKAAKYMEELNKEVELIKKTDLTGYFNTVADYANFVRDEDLDGSKYGIPGKKASILGPGRGSSGGSLVCYLMHITNVDPLRFNLFFERFLTAARVMNSVKVVYSNDVVKTFAPHDVITLKDGTQKEAWQQLDEEWETEFGKIKQTSFDFKDCPDIDLDFEASVIPQLNEYLRKRYGEYGFCQIGTQLLLKMSSAIKDICRIKNIKPEIANDIVQRIRATGWPIADWISEHTLEEFKQWICEDHPDDVVKDLVEKTDMFESVWKWGDRFRGEGIHASGYVISHKQMLGSLPLRYKDGVPITQFDHDSVARLGFIKYDILKLSSLSVIRDCYELVHNGNINVQDLYSQMRDEKLLSENGLWESTWKGDTLGIFQMDTSLGTKTANNAKITSLRDAAMLSAVDRPGMVSSGQLDNFYLVRQGKQPIKQYHPFIDSILKETDGFIVYQEQIMSIFGKLCNYAPVQRDYIRKVVGKKLRFELPKQKAVLDKCCLGNEDFVKNVPAKYKDAQQCIDDIWNGITGAGNYAFNKSHSLAYGMITSFQQYYKFKHPNIFMVASLNANLGDPKYVIYAITHGLSIKPPNVNKSSYKYQLSDGNIYMPLPTIKGVGWAAVKEIVDGAPYKDFEDYLAKTSGRGGRKKNIVTSLISIGAFDGVDARDRFQLMVDWKTKIGEEPPKRNTWKSNKIRGSIERELLGMSLSYDPVLDNKDWLNEQGPQSIYNISQVDVGNSICIAGKVTSIRRHQQKNGGTMAWITMQLVSHEEVQVTMFASSFSKYESLFSTGDIAAFNCKRTQDFGGKMSFVAFSMHNKSLEDNEMEA